MKQLELSFPKNIWFLSQKNFVASHSRCQSVFLRPCPPESGHFFKPHIFLSRLKGLEHSNVAGSFKTMQFWWCQLAKTNIEGAGSLNYSPHTLSRNVVHFSYSVCRQVFNIVQCKCVCAMLLITHLKTIFYTYSNTLVLLLHYSRDHLIFNIIDENA